MSERAILPEYQPYDSEEEAARSIHRPWQSLGRRSVAVVAGSGLLLAGCGSSDSESGPVKTVTETAGQNGSDETDSDDKAEKSANIADVSDTIVKIDLGEEDDPILDSMDFISNDEREQYQNALRSPFYEVMPKLEELETQLDPEDLDYYNQEIGAFVDSHELPFTYGGGGSISPDIRDLTKKAKHNHNRLTSPIKTTDKEDLEEKFGDLKEKSTISGDRIRELVEKGDITTLMQEAGMTDDAVEFKALNSYIDNLIDLKATREDGEKPNLKEAQALKDQYWDIISMPYSDDVIADASKETAMDAYRNEDIATYNGETKDKKVTQETHDIWSDFTSDTPESMERLKMLQKENRKILDNQTNPESDYDIGNDKHQLLDYQHYNAGGTATPGYVSFDSPEYKTGITRLTTLVTNENAPRYYAQNFYFVPIIENNQSTGQYTAIAGERTETY